MNISVKILSHSLIRWGLCVSYSIRQLQQPLSHFRSGSARVNSQANLTPKSLTPSSRMRGSTLIHHSGPQSIAHSHSACPPPRVHPAPSSWHNAALLMPLYVPYQSVVCLAAIRRGPSIQSQWSARWHYDKLIRGVSVSLRSVQHNPENNGESNDGKSFVCASLFFAVIQWILIAAIFLFKQRCSDILSMC